MDNQWLILYIIIGTGILVFALIVIRYLFKKKKREPLRENDDILPPEHEQKDDWI